METEELVPKLELGSIVALQSHFYSKDNESNTIYLSGEPQLSSPLMVIIEVLKVTKNSYDENTGEELGKKGEYQYKCMWYSSKSSQFEDAWISSKLLKVIQPSNQTENIVKKIGSLVELKTASLELGKKKITLKQTGNSEYNNYIVTAHLSFVSPIMQVIGTSKNEPKEPIFSSKTNEKIRYISNHFVKCKYYNPISDKLSEILIPVEALHTIQEVSKENLITIKNIIEGKENLQITYDSSETIIRPKKIISRAGRYYLKGYNYKTGNDIEINFLELGNFKPIAYEDTFLDELPSFNLKPKLNVVSLNSKTISDIFKRWKDRLFSISYLNSSGEKSKRVIAIKEIVDSKEKDDDGEPIYYIISHCFTKNDERYFKSNRIKKIKVLNVAAPNTPPVKVKK